MSEQQRNEEGHFTGKVTDQDILKVFDFADEPVLTASEVAAELPITREAAGRRLNQMRENGLVDRKKTGARSIAWWATVAPALSEETLRAVEQSEGELERGETVGQSALKRRLGMDG